VAAGAIGLAEAVVAVRRRGQYMQEAVPVGVGAMAAILGLDLPAVDAACREAAQGQVVSPANINSPGQVVIAGHKEAVERAIVAARAAGAKRAIPLPVSAPFHCALMMPAQHRLARDLAAVTFSNPSPPLVNNADARVVGSAGDCRDGLVRQVSAPVRWLESVQALAKAGVDTVVEVGPGTVLSGLVKKIDKGLRVLNVEDPASLEATMAALAEAR
jgi:[acyl-carrier-protein] S-malonyltransferase